MANEEEKRKRREILEDIKEEVFDEEPEEEPEEDFEEFSTEFTGSEKRKAPILGTGESAGGEQENLEGKLKEVPGSEGEKKKEEKVVYVSDYEDRHRFYDIEGIAQQRNVEVARGRLFERPSRPEFETVSPMARKSEIDSHDAKELMTPTRVEYKSEKGFLEFDPLQDGIPKGHGREELKKYRRG